MGKQKVVVSERDNIATLFEDDRAVEFIINRGDTLLGDLYLGTVENILPSIDAAFVNIGGDKMAFLHSSDVKGKGDLQKRLKPGQKMVLQVIKEPTGHKGPRVTTNISLPGRFLVFMPDSRGVSLSRKIESQAERSRLKAIVSMVKPHGVGVIIRTEANGQREADLQEDFEILMERWQSIVNAADTTSKHCLLYRDQDLLYRVIREVVNDEVDEIVVDTAFGHQRAQQLLQSWNLDGSIKATLHDGKQSIMVAHGVEREIKLALQTKVPLPSGGYLYIQPTEALTVVDVNSGKFTRLDSQAETIRLTNLEACKEIARQLRLRNIGGMIVVDFIDMEHRAHQLSVLEAFDKELAPDKSKPQMGQLTDLGLVEMTRHRQGQALSEIFGKECPMCHGRGNAQEQFHWAAPNAEAESRLFGRQRPNTPFKTQQRGRGYKSQSLKPLVTPSTTALRHTDDPARHVRPVRPGDNGAKEALAEVLKPEKAAEPVGPLYPVKPQRLDLKNLEGHFAEQMTNNLGTPLAKAMQVGVTPDRYNRTLSRMNTAATDILSLVQSIQTGGLDIASLLEDPSPDGQPIAPPAGQFDRDDRQRGQNQREGYRPDGQRNDQRIPAPGKAPLIVEKPRTGMAPSMGAPGRMPVGTTPTMGARSAGLPSFISNFLKKLPVGEMPPLPDQPPSHTEFSGEDSNAPGLELTKSAPRLQSAITDAYDAEDIELDAAPTDVVPATRRGNTSRSRRGGQRATVDAEVTTDDVDDDDAMDAVDRVDGSADDTKPSRTSSPRRRRPSSRPRKPKA